MQRPSMQMSEVVSSSPSVQNLPSGRTCGTHSPVSGSQVEAAEQPEAFGQTLLAQRSRMF